MNMKKIKFLLPILCALICLSFTVSAHSGRTDDEGGHHSGSGYHYHHGYPAHDHENGECPYDFHNNEKENYNSGNSSSDDEDEEEYTTEEHTTSTIKYDNEEIKNEISWFEIIFSSLLATTASSFLIIPLTTILLEAINGKLFKYSDDYTTPTGFALFISLWVCIALCLLQKTAIGITLLFALLIVIFIVWCIVSKISNDKGYQKHLEEERIKREKYEAERRKLLKYENKTKTEIFNMLFETNINITFNDKNLPIPHKKQGKFGEYTIYFSPSGKKIHYKKGCCNAICPEFRFKWHGSECSKCVHYKPKLPITAQQYYEYIKIIESLQKYNINIKEN